MLKHYIKKYRYNNLLILLLTFIIAGLQVFSSIIHTFSMDTLIRGQIRPFFLWNVFSLGLWGIIFWINYLEGVYEEKIVQKISTDIRIDITKKITASSFSNVSSKNEGTYVSWLNNDLSQIEDRGIRQYYAFWGYIFSVLLSAIALVAYHYSLIFVTFILMGILLKFPSLFEKKMETATHKFALANEQFVSKIQDIIAGYSVLFGYNKLFKMPQLIQQSSQDLADEKVEFAKTNKSTTGFIGIVNIFSQIAIVTYTGILAAFNLVSIGALSTTGNLASTIFNSISQGSSSLMMLKSVDTYFKKYDAFEAHTHKYISQIDLDKSIELKNITYKIAGKTILKNVNFTFEKGKKYAIIGPSGSGKSTLLNILSGRIDEYDGEILVDGKQLAKEAVKNLNSITAYTPQNAHIFNDKVINNISLWDENLISKSLESIKDLEIDRFIASEEVVEENGKNLSGGQKQRIAFARALTDSDKLILLDESTANLDKETALLLENTILNEESMTAVLVTHHLFDENKDKFDAIIAL